MNPNIDKYIAAYRGVAQNAENQQTNEIYEELNEPKNQTRYAKASTLQVVVRHVNAEAPWREVAVAAPAAKGARRSAAASAGRPVGGVCRQCYSR